MTVKEVPVHAFWTITVYDEEGYPLKGPDVRNASNNHTCKKDEDGDTTVHFTNERGKPNTINICSNWNYTVRLYEPMENILNNTWNSPPAKASPQPDEHAHHDFITKNAMELPLLLTNNPPTY